MTTIFQTTVEDLVGLTYEEACVDGSIFSDLVAFEKDNIHLEVALYDFSAMNGQDGPIIKSVTVTGFCVTMLNAKSFIDAETGELVNESIIEAVVTEEIERLTDIEVRSFGEWELSATGEHLVGFVFPEDDFHAAIPDVQAECLQIEEACELHY